MGVTASHPTELTIPALLSLENKNPGQAAVIIPLRIES
jgi:hypothetical protein